MIIGIGVDTVNIERFERIVTETPAFVRRVFTPNERTRNIRSQAVRFAAKETIAERARTLGINRLHLSLTHDEPVAVAIATAEYLSATELAHLKRFDPESYSMTVLTEDPTD